ncbi:permease of the drug/metabolite transporter superfamily [Aquitalea magnusonii]|uniref:Permease of the drug/metabolite transporter superfamily n=1 Tax=Aquitalea magnusonii TaxID=332411 RepID=A0A3G9GAI5_9NEIS|nr:DMT family transporter [Aquitalea magnusonii]BBF84505.1 permease of the drug/metabolite transporter superfamily [Aquitalea magnusonii]
MSLPSSAFRQFDLFMQHRMVLDVAAPIVFLLLWATGFAVVKIGLQHIEPLTFLALRYGCVVVILLPIQLGFRLPVPHHGRDWLNVCVIGVCIQVIYFGGTYLALRAGLSAGALALMVSLQPILVAIIAPIWIKERVSSKQWCGLSLGFAGAAIVILSKSAIESTPWQGITLSCIALSGMTLGVLYEKKTSASMHPISATLIQTSVGLLLIAPLALLLESGHIEWRSEMLCSLAYLVIGNSLIAIGLLLHLVRHRPASRVSALFFLVPPCAAIAAGVLLGESMPGLAWLGIGLATAGVWLTVNLR